MQGDVQKHSPVHTGREGPANGAWPAEWGNLDQARAESSLLISRLATTYVHSPALISRGPLKLLLKGTKTRPSPQQGREVQQAYDGAADAPQTDKLP